MGDLQGTEASAEHSDRDCGYKYKIGSGTAKTSVTINALNPLNVEVSSFSHSWSEIPDIIKPGQTINQTISVVNNGSSGKHAYLVFGETSIHINLGEDENVQAGGNLDGNTNWDNESQKQFTWTVPKPDVFILSDPKKYKFRISIGVSSMASGSYETSGYYTIEYEYRP